MTTRDTSRAAFRQLEENGDLSKRQAAVLLAVLEHGPATSAEIIERGALGDNRNLLRARFTELAGRGLIVETGTKKCAITGRSALVWKFTGRSVPLEPKHRMGAEGLRKLLSRAAAILRNGPDLHEAAPLLEEIKAAGVR